MASSRLSESDGSDYEEAHGVDLGLLSPAEMDKLRMQLSEKCSVANGYLLSSKEPVDKRRLMENTIQELLAAFNHVASAYERLSIYTQTLNSVKAAVKKSVREEVKSSVTEAFPLQSQPGRSYASVASRSSRPEMHKIKISNGPTVVVPDTVSFVIGPKTDHATNFSSSDDTRKAIMKAVKPGDVDLKVSRLLSIRNNAVRIVAEKADLNKLRSSSSLTAAGLEVKIKEKLNPRLIIRGVPTDIASDDLLKDIVAMNSNAGCTSDNVKFVYRYPPRDNRVGSSVVIETAPDVRRGLLKQERVYLSWQSCKVEDHLRVLQCFNCLSFGHLAKNCSAAHACGHCSGPHATASCQKVKSPPVCFNCVAAKLSNADHKAFDASKCSIIKQKIIEKARNISY